MKTDGKHPRLKIGVGIVCYIENIEELKELEKCLDSLSDFYPVFVIDGKWKDFEGKYQTSIPEINDLLESYSNVIHILSPEKFEADNRNKYLELSKNFNLDYLFWVDTDEWIELPLGKAFFERGIIDIFKNKSEKASLVHYYSKRHGGVSMQKRLIKNPAQLRHKNKHNEIFFKKINVLQSVLKAPRGLIIHSDKHYRSLKRECRMRERVEGKPITMERTE